MDLGPAPAVLQGNFSGHQQPDRLHAVASSHHYQTPGNIDQGSPEEDCDFLDWTALDSCLCSPFAAAGWGSGPDLRTVDSCSMEKGWYGLAWLVPYSSALKT